MSANYTKWANCWDNLTSLDSPHLEVFLGIFWKFFSFFEFKFEFWIGAGLIPAQTVTRLDPVKPDRFPPVSLTLTASCTALRPFFSKKEENHIKRGGTSASLFTKGPLHSSRITQRSFIFFLNSQSCVPVHHLKKRRFTPATTTIGTAWPDEEASTTHRKAARNSR